MNAQDILGLDEADRKLLERYLALPEPARTGALEDIAEKVFAEKVANFGSFASAKQRGFFSRLLRDAEGNGQPAQRGLPLQETIDVANALGSSDVEALRRAVKEEIQRHDETRRKLDEAKVDLGAKDVRLAGLQGEVNALRVEAKATHEARLHEARRGAELCAEIKRLSNAGPLAVSVSSLKAQAVTGLANEAAEGVRKAVLAILSPRETDPEAERERQARLNGERKRAPVDLEDPPGEAHVNVLDLDATTSNVMPEDLVDPDAGSPEGSTHVTGTCRKCGKFGMVRTHVRRCEACMPVPEAPAASPSGKTKAEAPEVPEAPAASPSGKSRLQKCADCGRFKIGTRHECRK